MKKSYQTHRSLRALAGWSLASLLTANSAFAATSASWTNSLSGYWGATTNWNPNTPPANAGDTASLNGSTDNLTVTNASAAGTAATNTVGTLNADLHYTLRPASSGNSLLVLDNGASSNPAFTISHSGGGYFTVYTPIQIASTNTRTLQVSGSLSMSAKIYSVISGPGGVYFEGQTSGNSSQGEPSIYLYNQSTYGGATEIGQANQAAGNIADGATVICNTNNSLPPTTVLTIDGNTKFTSLGFTMASGQYLGGTLNLNGYTNVLAGLSGGTSTGVAYSGTYSGNTYNEGRVENTASAPSLLDVSNTVSCVFNGKILQTSGTISLTKHGPASFQITSTNTYYTGNTVVNAGSLSLPSGQTGSGNFTVKDNAGLVIAVIPGQATLSMNILTIGTTNGTSLGVGYATNFTPTAITCSSLVAGGTNTVNVTGNASMPVTQQFSPGQYPLITYSAASGLTNTSFVMGTVPGGLKAYISNNLANSSIDLVITNITLGLTVTDATVYAISPTPASPTLNLSSLTLGTTNGAALGITMSGDSAAPVFASSLLVVHGTNIINVAGVGLTVGQFPLISYSTALGLTGADMVLGRLPSGVGGYLSNNVANLSVDLVITNVGVFLPLFWTGTSSSNWNQWVSANWLLNGAASIFIPGDAVIFNDAATGQTNINLATAVNPTSVVFSNSVLNYELQGGGAISGGASVTLSGNGQVTLATSNSHTGGTTLNSGTLNVNNASALGAAGNTFTIAGGTLDNTTGAGLTTLGYPQNWDGNFAFRGSASLGLGSGEASLGTNVSVDVNTNTLTVGGAITDEGNNYSLTKSGNGTLALSGGNTFSGGLYILAGTVQPSANSQALGGAGFGTVYLGDTAGTNSAALYGTGGGVGFANPIIVQQGSSGTVTLGNISGFFAGFSGAIILNRDLTVTTLAYTGGGTTFSGGISGVGGLNIVIGGGGNDALAYGLTLASYDSYTGGTTISNTTLILGSAGVIPNTTNIMLLTTTSYFDVSAQAGSFTLNSGQALGGSGLVHGGVNTASSSILAPGPSTGIGTLTLDSGLNLMGDVAVKLNKYLAQSNDMVVVQGNCANSGTGTLTVTNFGWGLIAGDKFTVFSQPLSGGDALTITGVPGVVWTNLLAVDGSIQVVSAPPIPATPPGFPLDAITELSGGNISLTVTGAIGTPYRLWASTNIALKPVASTWTLLQIGTINASPFTNVDLTATNYPRRFYLFSNP